MTTAGGLPPPIGLTWNLTYACNLACALCLSCSDRRDPRELSTPECETVVDELQRLHISTVHIGGGEPTVRPDFWHLLDYAANHQIGITFTTNGVRLTPNRARRLAAMPNVNVQVSVNGATAKVNDVLRGPGAFVMAWQAMDNLAEAGVRSFTISVTVTSYNVDHLDAFKRMANHFGARLRIVLPRSSGPHREIPNTLQPTVDQ